MGPIGRFQVMAVLQAARAHLLGLPIESAKSFGLNRAIFYAAAKRGFKKKGHHLSCGSRNYVYHVRNWIKSNAPSRYFS